MLPDMTQYPFSPQQPSIDPSPVWQDDPLCVGPLSLTSRLLVGTGKFPSPQIMAQAIRESGSEWVTVALRRIDFNTPSHSILSHLPDHLTLMPNTSGARSAEEAIRMAKLSRHPDRVPLIKIEVTPDHDHLMPDPIDTLRAAEALVKDGFLVLPYCGADPVLAKRLEEAGCVAVMPLGSPIGTNQGLLTREFIVQIIERATVPVIVDAGIGTPAHACEAMQLGADAVLINTAIATATHPVLAARAFKQAVIAGREGRYAGLRPPLAQASSASPLNTLFSSTP